MDRLGCRSKLDKSCVEQLLSRAHISPDARAEELSIAQWLDLARLYAKKSEQNKT